MSNQKLLKQLRDDAIVTKAGVVLADWLEDMSARAEGVLIYHQADSRKAYDLTPYMLENHGDEVAEGLELLQQLSDAVEVITCPFQEKASPALREPTSLYSLLETGAVRCSLAEHNYLSEYLSYGYHGRPTLVVNAEDCRMVADVANGRAVKKVIACMDGAAVRYEEVAVGTPLADVVSGDCKAVLLGGQTGMLLSAEGLPAVSFSYLFDSVEVLSASACGVDLVAKLMAQNVEDSCQRCVLCREGTWQANRIMQDVISGNGKETDLTELRDLARIVSMGSMCSFGQTALRPLASAMELFGKEFDEHILRHTCAQGVCCSSKSYQIDPYLCSGCTQCVDACEYDAIDGKKGFIHTVDEKMCEQCGACVEECPKEAIKFGANLKVPTRPTKAGRFMG